MDKYTAEVVRLLREEYGEGPEVPDELIADTFRARLLACDLAAADLGWLARRRYRRARQRFDRWYREQLADAVRRHFTS